MNHGYMNQCSHQNVVVVLIHLQLGSCSHKIPTTCTILVHLVIHGLYTETTLSAVCQILCLLSFPFSLIAPILLLLAQKLVSLSIMARPLYLSIFPSCLSDLLSIGLPYSEAGLGIGIILIIIFIAGVILAIILVYYFVFKK